MMENMSRNITYNTSKPYLEIGEIQDGIDNATGLRYIQQTIYIVIIVIGVIGNIFVLVIFGSNFSRKKTFDIYLFNLATADLLGVLFIPTYELHDLFGGDFLILADIGCKFVFFLKVVSVTASALIILIISIDRYCMVRLPMRNRLPTFTLLLLLLMPWLLGIFHGSIYLTRHLSIFFNGYTHQCYFRGSLELSQILQSITLFAQNIIPLFLIITLYVSLVYELKKSRMIFKNNIREILAREKNNKKTIQLAFVMVIVFSICTLPHNAYLEWYVFNREAMNIHTFMSVYSKLKVLFACNCCLNPFIYARLHRSFRKKLMAVFIPRRLRYYHLSKASSTTTGLNSTTESAHNRYTLRKIVNNLNINHAVTTSSNVIKDMALPNVVKETTLPNVFKETTSSHVVKETTLSNVVKETTL